MFQIFERGGLVMWPLLATSMVALAVVIERMIFILHEMQSRDPAVVGRILSHTESGDVARAVAEGRESKDFVARTLAYGLSHRHRSFSSALLQAANRELQRFGRASTCAGRNDGSAPTTTGINVNRCAINPSIREPTSTWRSGLRCWILRAAHRS